MTRPLAQTAMILTGGAASSGKGRRCSSRWTISITPPSHPRSLEKSGRKFHSLHTIALLGAFGSFITGYETPFLPRLGPFFEIHRDPKLLASVRDEVDACARECGNGRIQFDIEQLLRLPVLQAVYTETLRLRMHFYIIRMPDKTEMNIRGCVIPRQKVIVTLTTVAHMDAEAWSTGLQNEHPVD